MTRVDAELARMDARDELRSARAEWKARSSGSPSASSRRTATPSPRCGQCAPASRRRCRISVDPSTSRRGLHRERPDTLGAAAETHSAIVVFAGDRAYKLKKPVTFDFLDFSTRELRETAVHREVELNRRISPDVYLGVSDVYDVDGSICDHLVVMRRLPSDRRLSALVAAGTVTDDDLRTLARLIAVFHSRVPRTEATAAAGSPEHLATKLELDLGELQRFRGSILDAATLDEVATRPATRYVRGRARLFEARVEGGWVCDGHGDLLADDIFFLADGPRVLDCLDFSDELRYGDVLADIAFLAMDLERLGAPELAEELVRRYDEFSGERHPSTLVDYYVAFRALIRAKVAGLRVEQGDEGSRGTAGELLDLALEHLRRGRVAMVLVGGAPGTGKTTTAEALGARHEWAVLRSDVVRKELAGLDPRAPAPDAIGAGLYSPAATRRTYDELLSRADRARARPVGGARCLVDRRGAPRRRGTRRGRDLE